MKKNFKAIERIVISESSLAILSSSLKKEDTLLSLNRMLALSKNLQNLMELPLLSSSTIFGINGSTNIITKMRISERFVQKKKISKDQKETSESTIF